MGVVAGISAVASLMPAIKRVLDGVIGDKRERDRVASEIEAEVVSLLDKSDMRQHELNRDYAKSNSFFLAGARPMLLWMCVISFGYLHIIPMVLATFGMADIANSIAEHRDDASTELMISLLGLAGIRSYDKLQKLRSG